jgi:hypothetical protein
MLTSHPQNRYRCCFCGRELPSWLPVAKRPESSMLLYHLGQHHMEAAGLYLRGGRGAWKGDKEQTWPQPPVPMWGIQPAREGS